MQALWEAFPPSAGAAMPRTRRRSKPTLLAAIRAGDAVMVKGSLGSRMGPIVKALEASVSRATRGSPSEGCEGLIDALLARRFLRQISVLNVFRYITFRTGGAMITALLFVFLFGPGSSICCASARARASRSASDGPQSHLITKRGTPTMGGLMILFGRHWSRRCCGPISPTPMSGSCSA